MQKTIELVIERFAHDGAGEAHLGKDIVRVFGMLPGEKGIVEVQRKKGLYVGILKQLSIASPDRVPEHELHYLASSPWQIVSYPRQAEAKRELLESLFAYYDDVPKVKFVPADKLGGYRTKMEYCVTDRDVPLSLAFHERGGGSLRIPALGGSIMASTLMNEVALEVIKRMRDVGYTSSMIKTVVIRESKQQHTCLVLIYLKEENYIPFSLDGIDGLSGLMVFYSTPKSPASVATRELFRFGKDSLTDQIGEQAITYSWDSFFQNNVSMFEKALMGMQEHIFPGENIVELYSGVGTIGIALAKHALSVRGVEIVQNAVSSANENAKNNQIENYQAICLASEKIDEQLISGDNVLVLDPPRSGLHPDVIALVNQKLPKRIIYLSCNPETQARDYSKMSAKYKIDTIIGYDFYPQTPHLESLIVLSLR
jgi:23S rRNA (uracil1939-C5)-methyltransferase